MALQAPAGLRLRGGIDLGKVAQGITGVFKGSEQKAAEPKSATGELRLKGGEVSTCFDLLFCSSFVWACYFQCCVDVLRTFAREKVSGPEKRMRMQARFLARSNSYSRWGENRAKYRVSNGRAHVRYHAGQLR